VLLNPNGSVPGDMF